MMNCGCGRMSALIAAVVILLWSGASSGNDSGLQLQSDGGVTIDQFSFADMAEYVQSDYFRRTGKRCGVRQYETVVDERVERAMADCTGSLTQIQEEYWPSVVYTIPVWWHVISNSSGAGNIYDDAISAQMQVLNEDYRALSGTMGSQGLDVRIQFVLAGIDRTVNDIWFADNDHDGFKQALNKDPGRYLNIYTNNTRYLGYAYYPQGSAGQYWDGIVLSYFTVGGRNNGYTPFDQGRTLVHEMGHYFGLKHTFEDGSLCSNSYASGDLIVDTPAEAEEHYGCTQTFTCGTPDPIKNYMNYTDDTCMNRFTREQANRSVCGLVNYRPAVYTVTGEEGRDVVVPPFLMPLILSN